MIDKDVLGNWVLHGLVQEDSWDGAWAWSEDALGLPTLLREWLALFLYREGIETLGPAAKRMLHKHGFDPDTGMVL